MFSPLTSSPERLTRSGAEDTKYSKYGFSNTGASSSSGALGSALASPYTTSLASYSLENFRCARGGIATPIVSPISAMGESKGDQNINKVEKSPTAQWYSQLRTDEALRALVKTYGVPTTERMDAYSGWLLSCERGDAISKWLKMSSADFMSKYSQCGLEGAAIYSEGDREGMNKKTDPQKDELRILLRTIDVDLQRTHPDHPYFACDSEADGRETLRKILTMIAMNNDLSGDVGYLQGMNYLGGWLLLCFRRGEHERERAERQSSPLSPSSGSDADPRLDSNEPPSWCNTPTPPRIIRSTVLILSRLVTKVLPGYFTAGLEQLLADSDITTSCLRENDDELYQHFVKMGLDMNLLVPQWFICGFATSFNSMDAVGRIWDLLAMSGEGNGGGGGVYIWVAMGVLGSCRDELLATNSMSRAITIIRNYTKKVSDFASQVAIGSKLNLNLCWDVANLRKNMTEKYGRVRSGSECEDEEEDSAGRKNFLGGLFSNSNKNKRKSEAKSSSPSSSSSSSSTTTESWKTSNYYVDPATRNAQTPMTKKRRTALENFAVRNGIDKADPEGKYLFGRKKSDNIIDAAEGFFKKVNEMMTPTPAKKKRGSRRAVMTPVSKRNGSNISTPLFGGAIKAENSRVTFTESYHSPDSSVDFDENGEAVPPPPPTNEQLQKPTFTSPNSRGFEMTPIKSSRKKKGKPPSFTSPTRNKLASPKPSKLPGVMSPLLMR